MAEQMTMDKLLNESTASETEEWSKAIRGVIKSRIDSVNEGPFGTKWIEFMPGNIQNDKYWSALSYVRGHGGVQMTGRFILDIVGWERLMMSRKTVTGIIRVDVHVVRVGGIDVMLRYAEETHSEPAKLWIAWKPEQIQVTGILLERQPE